MTRVFVSLFFVACGLSALAGVATARRGTPPVDLRWAYYPEHHLLSAGDQVRLDGDERQLAYFLSTDDPLTIVEHYEAVWRAEGFEVARRYNEDEELLTASDEHERRSVVVARQGRVSVAWVSRRVVDASGYIVRAPIDESCTPVHHSASRDGGTLRELVSLSCDIEGDALIERYAEQLGSPNARLSDGRRAFASFGDAEENLDLAVYSTEEAGQAKSTATLRWEAQR